MQYMRPIQVAITLLFASIGILGLGRPLHAIGYVTKVERGEQIQGVQPKPMPANADLFERGRSKQDLEDYAGAITDYTEFLRIHPAHLEAYKSRGFAKAMSNDLKGAISDFDRAVEIAPHHADAYNARGNVHAMAGHLVASLLDFNYAIRLDRNFADAYYNRAISRHGLGDRTGAKSDLSKAAQLFRQQRDVGGYQQAREWIDKLR
jgi:tetratricopeptide (TPR) repeat protein